MRKRLYERWNAFYSRLSLRYVIWCVFTLTAVLGAGLIGASFYSRFSAQLQNVVGKQNRALMEQVNQTLTSELRNIMRISDSIYFSILKHPGGIPAEEGFRILYETNKTAVESIALFDEDGTLLVSAPAAMLEKDVDVREEKWFQAAAGQTENLHFSNPHIQRLFVSSENGYRRVISVSRMVQMADGDEVKDGILLIDMKYGQLETIFKNVSLGEHGYLYLVDHEGTLVYHPDHQLILDGIEKETHVEAAGRRDGVYEEVLDGEKRRITVQTVGYTGWKIVSVIPGGAVQLSTAKNLLFLIALALIFMLLLAVINSYISRKVTIPLEHLESAVKKISEGELEIEMEERGSYEIRRLGDSIKKMTVRIRELLQDIVKEQEIQRKNELNTLQAQINPHFLYNALDIVVWMVENEKPQDAVRALTALARFFRIGLSKGRTIIPVRDELEHVKSYLTIQKMRYKNKFEYRMEAGEEVLEMSTLKLILQPLVENSVAYGMEFQDDGEGEIVLRAYLDGEDLVLQVEDNGPGILPDRLDAIRRGEVLASRRGSGIGVKNVGERVHLTFGGSYGLEIESEPDEGTCITIRQPAKVYSQEEAQ